MRITYDAAEYLLSLQLQFLLKDFIFYYRLFYDCLLLLLY